MFQWSYNFVLLNLSLIYEITRVWGQFWPDILFLGISSCFMLVQILSVTLCEMLVQILSVSYLVLAVSLSFPCVRYM